MTDRLVDAVYYVKEYLGGIMFLTGVIFLFVGLLSFNAFGTVFSAASFFLGILLVVFGLFVQLGVFSVKVRSLNGVSLIFICVSIIFIAFSIVVLEFLTTELVAWEDFAFRYTIFYTPILRSERLYLQVSGTFMLLGLALLIVGIVLRVYNALKF